MSREYPDWVDPWKVAEGSRIFSGSMPLERMQRLRPVLANAEGEAHFSVAFGLDPQDRVTVSVEVEAELPLVCQRSLETYLEPVRRKSLLGVITDPDEERLMPENYEPVLVEEGRLSLQQLVEDELLLALPQVPRSPAQPDFPERGFGDVEPAGVAPGEPKRQPFAGLADQIRQAREGK